MVPGQAPRSGFAQCRVHRHFSLGLLLALPLARPAWAGSVDGIWLEQGMPNCYWMLRENAGTLVAVQLCNERTPDYYAGAWEVTAIGSLSGAVAQVTWNLPTVSGTGTVTFTSATFRTDTCTLKPGAPSSDCDAVGSAVTLTKFF